MVKLISVIYILEYISPQRWLKKQPTNYKKTKNNQYKLIIFVQNTIILYVMREDKNASCASKDEKCKKNGRERFKICNCEGFNFKVEIVLDTIGKDYEII